jgi:hypothetical protein
MRLHPSPQEIARAYSMLSKRRIVREGSRPSYTPVLEFVNRATADRFRDAVLLALDAAELGGER